LLVPSTIAIHSSSVTTDWFPLCSRS
jgi:hypothetical protein